MNNREIHPLHAAINHKLAAVLESTDLPPAWADAWLRLGPESTEEERLAVYRAVRDAGVLPAEAGFFLVSWQIDAITLQHAEEALQPYETRVEALRRKHGLSEDQPPPTGEGPPDYEEAQRQLYDAWDVLYATQLDKLGEPDMARLFRENREEFEHRSQAGQQFFHGPRAEEDAGDDDWLDDLLEAVGGCVEADSPMGPLGMRYREEDGFWEIWIYPTPVELVGGRHDGKIVVPGFTLDLEKLQSAFDSVVAFSWNALGFNYEEGPHVAVEGVYQGREVLLEVLAQAPEGEEPGLRIDATKKRRRRR